jgi:hypothetical protein
MRDGRTDHFLCPVDYSMRAHRCYITDIDVAEGPASPFCLRTSGSVHALLWNERTPAAANTSDTDHGLQAVTVSARAAKIKFNGPLLQTDRGDCAAAMTAAPPAA